MRYAIAIWNYCWHPGGLPEWIREFADQGFDTISFNPGAFAAAPAEDLARAAAALRERDLVATVHGSCDMDRAIAVALIDALGDRLVAFTIDPARSDDSRGTLYDARRIATVLRYLRDAIGEAGAWTAVEDFPLDALARDQFAAEMGGLWDGSRTGILVDVGHMHLRRTLYPYFREKAVGRYFADLPLPLVEVHLHDNHGEKDEHGHFGLGTVPFSEVAEALKAVRFDGVSTIEIAPGFHGSTPEGSRPRAAASLAQWRQLMG